MLVYLAGYIDSEQIEKCAAWRRQIVEHYAETSLIFLDPLNGKDFAKITTDGLKSNRSPASILTRDMMSVHKADLIIANMDRFGRDRVSVGTISEIAWGLWDDKPIIMITDEEQYILHPFYSRIVAFYKSVGDMLEDDIITYYLKGVRCAIYPER